jgi:putative ABC transport system substrate-binding protein
MHMNRRHFLGAVGATTIWPHTALAQQKTKPVIGWLGSTIPLTEHSEPFLAGLKDEGFDGDDFAIHFRWAEGHYERLPVFAAEFVQQRVDLIAAIATVSAITARDATNSIPTVFVAGGDPVAMKLVSSMNRPGGNRTGVTLITHMLDAKRIELLRELAPAAKTLGVILNPNSATAPSNQADVQAAAGRLDLQAVIVNVASRDDLEPAFAELSAKRVDVLLVGADSLLHSFNRSIVRLAERYRMPAAYEWRENVQIGGLISYGTNIAALIRQLGGYGGRILKGTKPSDLPVIGPSKYELAINLKTAKALGLTVPSTLLARADEVIE